jgi:RNA 3'-terminal phosphate cyclase (ATP)
LRAPQIAPAAMAAPPKRQRAEAEAGAADGALAVPAGAVHIDGSMLEGGGQLLRNAAALAAVTGAALHVDRIRAGRDRPGLRPQHLAGLHLVADLCGGGGALRGVAVRATAVALAPGPLRCADAVVDPGTAASCVLLAQTALPCLLLGAAAAGGDGVCRLELRGGTDASLAPPVGYLEHVLLPTLRAALGVDAAATLRRRGFYPKGGGAVELAVRALAPGAALPPLRLAERGELVSVRVRAFTAGRVGRAVGERMAAAAAGAVRAALAAGGCGAVAAGGAAVAADAAHEPPARAVGDGCGVLLVAETTAGRLLGASALGARGVTAEAVGAAAAAELVALLASGAAVDDWLVDQLIIFMALAAGESELLCRAPTLHARTAIAVAEALTPAHFSEEVASMGALRRVRCRGAGAPAARGADGGGEHGGAVERGG